MIAFGELKLNLVSALACLLASNIFFTPPAPAQNQCETELLVARQRYDDGFFQDAVALLEGCLKKNGLTPHEQEPAYALLAQVHLANGDNLPARIAAEKLVEVSPDYTPRAKDRSDFRALIEEIKKQPRPALILPVVEERPRPRGGSKKWWWIGGGTAITAGIVVVLSGARKSGDKNNDNGFTNPPERP